MDKVIPGIVIGVDEAGRGPVIGPMVVCAVLTNDQEWLRKLGVRDSKALSPGRREELASGIRRRCQVETVILAANDIDAMRGNLTLNEIEVYVFSQAILKHLIDRSPDEVITIVLDAADVNEKRFGMDIEKNLLMKIGSVPSIISKHKADDLYPAVSAASIIAKVTRDQEIERIKEKYGNVGSGYPSDPRTRAWLRELFKSGKNIPSFVRMSWETISKIKEGLYQPSLTDFNGK